MTRWTPCLLLLASACTLGGEPEDFPVSGDVVAFAEQAQPVFAARCASPSCHGSVERPLSLYAVHRFRIDPADANLDAPLSDEELHYNLLRASAFLLDIDHASQSLLLTKPLAHHAGVEVFVDDADYDCRRLRSWIEGALQERGEHADR